MKRRVVISGSVAQRPGIGGHTWVFLQYALGFKRLGWDVLFIDRLEPAMRVDRIGRPSPIEACENLRYSLEVMRRFGLENDYVLLCGEEGGCLGMPREEILSRVRGCDLLLDIMGFLGDDELRDAASCRVFLDIDPGFGQMWHETGLASLFGGHDLYVTIGGNVGAAECRIPTCGLDWVTTPQPIVLSAWPSVPPPATGCFTSVASWRGPFAPVEYQGESFGLRAHEFRRFFELPERTDEAFRLALEIAVAESSDLRALEHSGWLLVDPRTVAGDPWRYQEFVQESRAEFMVAKNMYVRSRSGWFSDRSICYLASGRPVLAQDTGLADLYPTSSGLVTYDTVEEASEGARAIARDYSRHCRAARAIAEEHFDSDVVLPKLVRNLGVA